MKRILIRYTDKKYVDSYRNGDLYLSSLSSFWNVVKLRQDYNNVYSKNADPAEVSKSVTKLEMRQQDFQEGVATQIPKKYFEKMLPHEFTRYQLFDVRCRLEAYGFCNLLCFYRVDILDTTDRLEADMENIAEYLNSKGLNTTTEQIQQMGCEEFHALIKNNFPHNYLLSQHQNHIIQLPCKEMDNFGDMVVIIKNEEEFINRIINAVERQGGDVITGNVKYHPIKDRSDPDNKLKKNYITFMIDPPLDYRSLINDCSEILWYGCLDKYDMFAKQKEWRVCWLPVEKNYVPKYLHIGNTEDIMEFVPSAELKKYLINTNPGYYPAIIRNTVSSRKGTIKYSAFKKKIESIDGLCRIITEFG